VTVGRARHGSAPPVADAPPVRGRGTLDPGASTRTVVIALGSNIGVAAAKIVAAVFTGSVAMSAEAWHAVADTGNQVLLLVAQRRSIRPRDDRHPFGHGREAYFWALIASIGVFMAGAVFSLREGIAEIVHPSGTTGFVVVYAVLAVSVVLDSVSLVRASRQLRAEATHLRRDFVDQIMLTSDPTVRAVFAEDAAAIAGDLIALVGVAIQQATGSTTPEAVAAMGIGLLLIGVGVELARRNHDFLLGEQAPPSVKEPVEAFILGHPGVRSISELLVTFVGPRRVWVLARIDIADDLRGDEVEALVRAIASGLAAESDYVDRVDIVPIGPARPMPVGGRT